MQASPPLRGCPCLEDAAPQGDCYGSPLLHPSVPVHTSGCAPEEILFHPSPELWVLPFVFAFVFVFPYVFVSLLYCRDCLPSFLLFQIIVCLDHMSYKNLGDFHSLKCPWPRQELPPSPLVPARRLWTPLQRSDSQTHWCKASTQRTEGMWSQVTSIDLTWKAPTGGKRTNHWITPPPGCTFCTESQDPLHYSNPPWTLDHSHTCRPHTCILVPGIAAEHTVQTSCNG